jgi:UPF0755 protein
MKMTKLKKTIIIVLTLLITAVAGIGYMMIFSSNTHFEEKSYVLFIHETSDLETWMQSEDFKKIVSNVSSFQFTAKLKKVKTIKPGRYRIKSGMHNSAMLNMLRSGNQEALSIRTDDVEDIYSLAGKLGKKMKADSLDFIQAFTDEAKISAYGFNTYTLPCMLFPNTYEFFWTMSPEDFLAKMKKLYDEYWTQAKKDKAAAIGLTPIETGILASIVKAETAKKDEAPYIAGLYLNRLRIGMALQSDPTAVFGRKVHAERVYLSDLKTESPYNTYLIKGLPPGPINFPEIIYLDAVLNAVNHTHIYMCAQPGGTGYHNFSRTLEQHNVYRNEYTSWLEKNGVR